VRRWARLLLAAAVLLLATPALAKKPLRPGERIDLNRASAAELMRLPGVGAKRAQAIVSRRARGPFRTPAEVLAVKGLGKAWFRAVQGHLVATPVRQLPAPTPASAASPDPAAASRPAAPAAPARAAPAPTRVASR
jgi:competence ComEA-like helix-hairpin-helix protein